MAPFRIAVVNNRFFISGGPERYLFNFSDLFSKYHHQIIPFCLDYKQNALSDYAHYFVKPLGKEGEIYFENLSLSIDTLFRIVSRSFYSFEVKRAFSKLLNCEKIQIAYLLQHYGTFSPSIIDAAKRKKIPVVLRTSDFFLMCLNTLFLKKNRTCEDCLKKNLWQGVKDRCVKDSFWMSLFRAAVLSFHRTIKIYEKVDAFVCPSGFMAQKLKEFGFPEEKIHKIPSFLDPSAIQPDYTSDPYVLYFGRISHEKGILDLVKAWHKLKPKSERLLIVGNAHNREDIRIKQWVEDNQVTNIEFRGFQTGQALTKLISRARFTIVPSICYENMPNTLLESFAYGKPVIASNLGSIPETVRDGVDGVLFNSGNTDELAAKLAYLLDHSKQVVEMGQNARKHLEEDFSPSRHYQKLMEVFLSLSM